MQIEDTHPRERGNRPTKVARVLELSPDRLRERVRDALVARDMSQAQLARSLEYSPAALCRWLSGDYTRNDEALRLALHAWLASTDRTDTTETPNRHEVTTMSRKSAHAAEPELTPEEEREQELAEEDRRTFVETPTSASILGALAHAQTAGDMVVVFGAPGSGKTRTITHYRHEYEQVYVATITPASAAVVPALEEVAEACGLHDAGGGARKLARSIRNKVAGTTALIIIDEAQHLSIAAVEELRSIHDATGCGLALVGNEHVYSRLTGGNKAVHFAQLFSRLGMRLNVRKPSPEDVTAIASKWRVKDKKSLELLGRIASRPGALRSVVKVLRLAAENGSPSYDRIRAACDHLQAEVV